MSQEYDEDDIYGIGEKEQLVAINPRATPESSPDPISKPVSPPAKKSAENAKARRKTRASKGDAYLLCIAHPNYPEVHRTAEHHLPRVESEDESMEDVADMDERLAQEMIEKDIMAQMKPKPLSLGGQSGVRANATSVEEREMLDVADMDEYLAREMEVSDRDEEEVAEGVQQIAAHALNAADAFSRMGINSPPAQQLTPTPTDQVGAERRESSSTATTATTAPSRKQSDGLGIWIKPETPSPFTPMTPIEPNFHNSDPFSVWSPLAQHRNSIGSPGGKIPAMLPGPASPEAAGSPRTLPSAKEILDIANKANEAQQHRNRHASLSSVAIPSPQPNGGSRASFSNTHPSPSMTSEPRSTLVLSPPSGVLRRESYPLPSSASTTSHSIASPDVTSPHLLPSPQSPHRQSIDENTRTLPPIPGLGRPSINIETIPATGSGGYKCEFLGCTAAPFQTSYLLNSHANVHSTNRPHYCTVPGCPRGEGGKGFKRKNEMIRHGLVHASPGYVCPFCSDREHKYPRPDNLQRHVRVHHTDKSREDPALKGVLAQRLEPAGANRGRKRRNML